MRKGMDERKAKIIRNLERRYLELFAAVAEAQRRGINIDSAIRKASASRRLKA